MDGGDADLDITLCEGAQGIPGEEQGQCCGQQDGDGPGQGAGPSDDELALFLTGYPLRTLAQGDIQISVPATHELPPGSLDPQTVTVFAERLRLVVTEAPQQALVLMWSSTLLSAFCFLITALTCVVLCYRLARQVPFGAFMQRSTAATGILALAAGVAAAILEGYAKYLTVHSLPGLLAGGNAVGVGTPGVYIVDSLNPVLFVIGLILLLLAAVLSRGTHYYRDVKDLV